MTNGPTCPQLAWAVQARDVATGRWATLLHCIAATRSQAIAKYGGGRAWQTDQQAGRVRCVRVRVEEVT